MSEDQNLVFKLKDLTKDDTLKKVYVVLSKTKSLFNRGVNELPKIKDTILRYLNDNPKLGEYEIKILPKFPNAYFNFADKKFALGLFNADILAHEIEHALSTSDANVYNKMLTGSRAIANLSSRFSIPLILGQSMKMQHPEMVSDINKLYDILSATHGVASVPTLYEEGQANLGAIMGSPDKWQSLKTLGPAYATYLAKAAIPIGVYQLAKQDLKKLMG